MKKILKELTILGIIIFILLALFDIVEYLFNLNINPLLKGYCIGSIIGHINMFHIIHLENKKNK